MKTMALCIVFTIGMAMPAPQHSLAGDTAARERERIHALLDALERSGLEFIRNGFTHTAREARAHLEMKLDRAGGRVTTAEQFIRHCATRSSLSGRPYLVRLADGSTVHAADWLRARLAEIDSRSVRKTGRPK